MFHPGVSVLEVAARTAIVYIALLAGLRLAGKRQIGQMTPFDLVVILLIANAVQNAMVGPDTSLTGGLVSAAVLIGGNYAIAFGRDRIPWMRGAIEGSPTLLVRDGALMEENLKREGVDPDEVLMAIREHGVASLEDVATAVLEVDGSISIVPKEGDSVSRTQRHLKFLQRKSG